MKRSLYIALLTVVVLFTGCHPKPVNHLYDPRQVAFNANYNDLFDDILYPSMILAQSHYTGAEKNELFSIQVTAPANNSVLRVVVDSSAFNYVTIVQEILPRRGERYTFVPSIKWKYDKLYHNRQQGAIDLTFTCYINDEEVDTKTLNLNVRSVNDCLLSTKGKDGKTHDYRWLFMGYVNEEHPFIDSILTRILSEGIITTFTGYQKGAKQVKEQVFAIWYYALNHGITYSSISCTANPSKRSTTQHIRFFDEVYNSRQANCIDACVFFASILRKIGLKPVILVEPCHAYLGYYTDKQKKADLTLLETTITGWVNFPTMDRQYAKDSTLRPDYEQKVKNHLSAKDYAKWTNGEMDYDEMKIALARSLFDKATKEQEENYRINKKHFLDTNQMGFQMLQVEELRRVVQPISAQEF